MQSQIPIPEGLSKYERRQFIKNWERQQRDKQRQLQSLKKLGVFSLLVILVALGLYYGFKRVTKPLPGEFVQSLGNRHIESVTTLHDPYNSLPPTSGPHVGGKADWGISDKPIPNELQVHNLEDGGVVVQYNCMPEKEPLKEATPSTQELDQCKKLVEDLLSVVARYKDQVLLAPYPTLNTKIALTAWTRIDKFNEYDKDRIEIFIKAFRGIDHHRG